MNNEIQTVGEGEHGVAVDYLVVLQELAMEHGISPKQSLQDTGIPLNALIRPNVRIGDRSMSKVIENLLALVKDPTLPIQYGKRVTMFRHGALGYALQGCGTMEEAFVLMIKYIDIRSGGGQRFRLVKTESKALAVFSSEREETSVDVERFLFLYMLFNVEYLGRYLTNSLYENVDTEIHLSVIGAGDFPKAVLPPGLVVKFGQPANQIVMPLSYFQRPISNALPGLLPDALNQCENELLSLDAAFDLPSLIRKKLRESSGKMPLTKMADLLHLSPSSLKRKLHETGLSYQKLRDSEQFKKAIHLLESTDNTLEEITELLGYGDTSNFIKAFKQWSGMTPNEYRRSFSSSQPK